MCVAPTFVLEPQLLVASNRLNQLKKLLRWISFSKGRLIIGFWLELIEFGSMVKLNVFQKIRNFHGNMNCWERKQELWFCTLFVHKGALIFKTFPPFGPQRSFSKAGEWLAHVFSKMIHQWWLVEQKSCVIKWPRATLREWVRYQRWAYIVEMLRKVC